MSALARALLVVLCTATPSTAERRVNTLSDPDGRDVLSDHRGRVLIGVGGSLGDAAHGDAVLRAFVDDRLTIGGRSRFVSSAARALELDIGYSIRVDEGQLPYALARTDLVVSAGAGVTSAGAPLAFAGLGLRVHPRASSNVANAVAFELGARGTRATTSTQLVAEVTFTAAVMWPPPKRWRSCSTMGWK